MRKTLKIWFVLFATTFLMNCMIDLIGAVPFLFYENLSMSLFVSTIFAVMFWMSWTSFYFFKNGDTYGKYMIYTQNEENAITVLKGMQKEGYILVKVSVFKYYLLNPANQKYE